MKVLSTALLVLGLMSPAVAQASTTVTPVVATSAATSADKSVSVSCPSGTRVIGAGGAVTGVRTTIMRVRPSEDLTSVEVTAVEHGGGTSQSWKVTARANCAPGSVTLVSKSSTKNAEAACPDGKKALGVAGEVDGGHLTRMAPRGDLEGALVEGSNAVTVTAHVLCGNRPGLVLRGGVTSVVMTKTATKSVACQDDEQPVSAGGAVAGAVIDDVVTMGAAAVVSGESTDAQGQAIRWSITPYVVCSQ